MQFKDKFERLCEKIAIGLAFGLILTFFIFFKVNLTAFGQIILYDTIPNSKMQENLQAIFEKDYKEDMLVSKNISAEEKPENLDIIGKDDIAYEEIKSYENSEDNNSFHESIDVNRLGDLNYLREKFYIVDKKTSLTPDYFNVNEFLNTNLKIEKDDFPKVLIFHTHSREMFKDSNTSNLNEGIVGAGTRLAKTLEKNYGIKTLHVTESFDTVNGKSKLNGAYERMEPRIRTILKENPSIELVIDLHRDGVNENVRLVENINGKPTAKLMFFNGISRIIENGKLTNISNLTNKYVKQNLALSFNMQKKAMEKYPGLTRKIYINAYRYSLHMKPMSMLVEAGAQTNTKEEIYNAMDLLAEIINDVIFS